MGAPAPATKSWKKSSQVPEDFLSKGQKKVGGLRGRMNEFRGENA